MAKTVNMPNSVSHNGIGSLRISYIGFFPPLHAHVPRTVRAHRGREQAKYGILMRGLGSCHAIIIPMRTPDRDMARVVAHRMLTEERLSALLIRAGRPTTLDRIKAIIFDKGHTQLIAYVAEMIQVFQSSEMEIDDILSALQDAWNYFPHRSLDGQSPAERLLDSHRA